MANQKKYLEAREVRTEWQDLLKENFMRVKEKTESNKAKIFEEFEKKQEKDLVDFEERVRLLRLDHLRQKQTDIVKLAKKFKKINEKLEGLQSTEKRYLKQDIPLTMTDGQVIPSVQQYFRPDLGTTQRKMDILKSLQAVGNQPRKSLAKWAKNIKKVGNL